MAYQELSERIASGKAVAGIIGLGYVGLPLLLTICEHGGQVVGFDIDTAKIAQLNTGESYLRHISSDRVAAAVSTGRIDATAAFERIKDVDIILICVPTPLTRHREPDMRYIRSTMDAVAPHLRAGQLLCLESTTYPGTSRELIAPQLAEQGFTIGEDVFLAYSPEREDPGNGDFQTRDIPKVVGADDKASLTLAEAFYSAFVASVAPVSTLATAEAVKLTENIFRAVNIALVNELKTVYAPMGIDVWEVIDAAKTKPFGFMPFYPGPGLGGHCIPIDPFYLTWKAREYEIPTRFIELAGEVNLSMPRYVVRQLTTALDQHLGLGLSQTPILIVGLAYKKNLNDTRESASLKVMRLLRERGAETAFLDPHIQELPNTREYSDYAGEKRIEMTPEALSQFKAAIICTDHDDIDYAMLGNAVHLVVDTRNVMQRLAPEVKATVIKA